MSSPMPSLINQVARGCRAVCAQQVLPLDSPVSKPAAMSLQQVAPCRWVAMVDVEVEIYLVCHGISTHSFYLARQLSTEDVR